MRLSPGGVLLPQFRWTVVWTAKGYDGDLTQIDMIREARRALDAMFVQAETASVTILDKQQTMYVGVLTDKAKITETFYPPILENLTKDWLKENP